MDKNYVQNYLLSLGQHSAHRFVYTSCCHLCYCLFSDNAHVQMEQLEAGI